MAYIIENANILKDKKLTRCSMLIRDNRITEIKPGFNHFQLMKMNGDPFIMTPSFCVLNTKIPLKGSFQEVKEFIVEQFLLKGCTTFFTYINISYENELLEKMKKMKTALMSCPIDFIVGVKIPLRLVTPSFIRMCKKARVPAIFIDIKEADVLEKMPWGWIREALFPFNCPLVPIISSSLKKEAKNVLSKWKGIMLKEKIPSVYEEIEENKPLSLGLLNKVGLYPQKGSLMQGTDLSYNLYLYERGIKNVDEVNLFHYHGDRLVVTVHKGTVIRAGVEVLFKPGYGEHVKIRTPSYFSL